MRVFKKPFSVTTLLSPTKRLQTCIRPPDFRIGIRSSMFILTHHSMPLSLKALTSCRTTVGIYGCVPWFGRIDTSKDSLHTQTQSRAVKAHLVDSERNLNSNLGGEMVVYMLTY
ncbi:hypothetical protein KY289_014369 [Solanum tuberosum]|nr:hypothetical protein KY289_014369 [Solanum tuberosum]